MPELPEVETIRRNLRLGSPSNPPIIGGVVRDVQILWERTLDSIPAAEFSARLPGQFVREIGRRGKYLIFWLTEDVLLVHLRMSGDLVIEPVGTPIAVHHRLIINFENGQRLAFNDPRKFGRVWLASDENQVVGGLGPEPLEEDFTSELLFEKLHNSRRQLKPLLLDQTFLAGLGNIYADEALNRAGLHPLTAANLVSQEQAAVLRESIWETLQEGIRRNGASIDWVYRGGEFQNYFRVYQRTGEPCLKCGTRIERIVVGQRGTHFCPRCQPMTWLEEK